MATKLTRAQRQTLSAVAIVSAPQWGGAGGAHVTGMHRPLVDRLVRQGLLETFDGGEIDGTLVRLTDAGRAVLEGKRP